MKILIKGARIVDPASSRDGSKTGRIFIEGGVIRKPPPHAEKLPGIKVIDGRGMVAAPGLVDMHVHLREPGFEHKETIKTGTMSAVAGGFTAVACMPNTRPVNDNAAVTQYILMKARTEGSARVFPIGAITKNEEGKSMADIGEMCEAGCVAISDDGFPVVDSAILRRAMEYAKPFGVPVISHCEDMSLSADGVMNEGYVSNLMGLRGIPAESEEICVSRDITLSRLTGAPLHIAHVSAAGSVAAVRRAKKEGVRVTAEATPHHFTLSDEAVRGYKTNAKMNPPLRTQKDINAIWKGLADGTIDAIATDHAPHSHDEKNVEFDKAPFGIVGLETALSLSLRLVDEGVLSLSGMVEKMSTVPALILGTGGGTLKEGAPADVVVFDPEEERVVNAEGFYSKGRSTPFDGETLKGVVKWTIVGGVVKFSQASARP
ncbi:MAG: dihydroorotase [Candidatus Dadabacteria bacterium]|nr:dihydroorotase [Candidatus Dadabacteria bacterium]